MDTLSFAARLLIGGILIAAATPKLLAPLRFQQIVMQYSSLPPATAPGLPFRLSELAGHPPGTHAVLLGSVLATLAVSCAVGYFARWRAPTGEKGGTIS